MFERSVEEIKFLSQVIHCSLSPLITRPSDCENLSGTNFFSKRKPTISLIDYIKRIINYSDASNEAFILSVFYIYKLKDKINEIFINEYSIHRIYLTSLLISIKYIDDMFYDNRHYARVGGISVFELNKMELEFLARMNFDFYFEEDCLYNFYEKIIDPVIKDGRILLFKSCSE
jgi:hypothetical protein